MKEYRLCLLAALGMGCYSAVEFLYARSPLHLSDIIIQLSSQDTSFLPHTLLDLAMQLFPILLFQLLFGSFLYKEFCSVGVYIFSRCVNRLKWFIQKVSVLLLYALLYQLAMTACTITITAIFGDVRFDLTSFILFLYYWLIYALWLFQTTLLINILSLKTDSGVAFGSIYGLQTCLILILFLWRETLPLDDSLFAARNFKLLWLDPIPHLIISWHSSIIPTLDARIHAFDLPFDLNLSVLYFLILSVLAVITSYHIIKHHDMITSGERGSK
ncbi:MAG: hypothetical protein GX957_07725 [Clostridiaceae bacterium]|nr:hypothetical protein [Clostridiaceae bacterium]